MNGLQVSRVFFEEWGLPYLQRQFPALVDRVAVGLLRGSQVFEADDRLSQDHGWGPTFWLMLTEADFQSMGTTLQEAVNRDAPREWAGYRFHYPPENIYVRSITRYLEHRIGFADANTDIAPWLEGDRKMREHELYLLRHSHVFHDPSGAFSERKKAFASYPRQVFLRRLLDELFNVWHYGQYNYVDRQALRNDPVADQIALGYFTESTMRVGLLLSGDFSPYWKWLAFEFRKCSNGPLLDKNLHDLTVAQSQEDCVEQITVICDKIHDLLISAELAHTGPHDHPHSLWRDHGNILKLIN